MSPGVSSGCLVIILLAGVFYVIVYILGIDEREVTWER